MDDRAEAWLRRRTSHWRDWPADRLLEALPVPVGYGAEITVPGAGR